MNKKQKHIQQIKLVKSIFKSARGKTRDVKRLRKLGTDDREIARTLGIDEDDMQFIQ